jgi:serine/threonine protein kinase
MELAEGGEFASITDKAKETPLKEAEIYEYAVQIVLGMMRVHQASMNHGDLKP